jgi:restriction endonuclease S subunit
LPTPLQWIFAINETKKYLEDLEIPIPKTPELINKWVSQISEPYEIKQQKEIRLKELEEEIKNKIKDIQENYECEEVKLSDICKINSGKLLPKNNIVKGKFDIIGGGKIIGKHNISNREGNDIVLTRVGAININYISEPYYLTDNGLAIKSQKYNNMLIYYYMIINLDYIYKLYNGSNQKVIKKTELENFRIAIPKDKILINNLQPLFNEIEELQKEIKELDETYNNQLKELKKAAIINDNGNNNYTDIISIEEDINNDEEIEEIQEETPSIKSTKSQTLEELKEQCKTLGIKGYSKKKKDELIELIKNHK